MNSKIGAQEEGSGDARERVLERLDRISRFYDSAFAIPGTKYRIGWDSIFGLIPGVGDVIGVAPLAYYIKVAHRYNMGTGVYLRLVANQGVDFLLGSVPLVGDLFDWGFKANVRNAKILRSRLR